VELDLEPFQQRQVEQRPALVTLVSVLVHAHCYAPRQSDVRSIVAPDVSTRLPTSAQSRWVLLPRRDRIVARQPELARQQWRAPRNATAGRARYFLDVTVHRCNSRPSNLRIRTVPAVLVR
jgi:hypothetical protein